MKILALISSWLNVHQVLAVEGDEEYDVSTEQVEEECISMKELNRECQHTQLLPLSFLQKVMMVSVIIQVCCHHCRLPIKSEIFIRFPIVLLISAVCRFYT